MVKNFPSRWLILTQYYAPEIGAPQIRLRLMARELRRNGFEVRVLTGMPNYPAGKIHAGYEGRWMFREQIDGVNVLRTWTYAATGKSAIVRLANYFSFTLSALWAAFWGPKPDVMFVESQPLSLGMAAVLMKWLRGVPYIYNVPDLQVEAAQQLGFIRNRAVLRLASALEDFFLKQSWKVSTVTHQFIRHFMDRGLPRSQVTFLPNGAQTDFLRPRPASGELLSRWELHGKKVFLYVGTHAFYHGLDTLLDAAELLRDKEDVAFVLVGDGPERERLKLAARARNLTNMVFGDSPYEEMDQLFSIAYASFAVLRKLEVAQKMRLSKIFPSLSCGVPVIYSGEGEAADLLKTNRCGIVVPPENAKALAAAISMLAEDTHWRDRMGALGRQWVEKEYSWAAIVCQWLDELGYQAREAAAPKATRHPARPRPLASRGPEDSERESGQEAALAADAKPSSPPGDR